MKRRSVLRSSLVLAAAGIRVAGQRCERGNTAARRSPEKNHILPDGLAPVVQFICREFWIGIADSSLARVRRPAINDLCCAGNELQSRISPISLFLTRLQPFRKA